MFNTFKKVLNGQTIHLSDADKVSTFLLLRWLSGDPRLMPLAAQINATGTTGNFPVDNLTLLKAIQTAIHGKIRFIKFPSAKKPPKDYNVLLEKISEYFRIGPQEALEYYTWMETKHPEELDTLRTMFKMPKLS